MGDNRDRSSDSRVLGTVPSSDIVAKITKVVPARARGADACRR
jgi:hypothetical protein